MRPRPAPSGLITLIVLLSACAGGSASPSSNAADVTSSPRATPSSSSSPNTTATAPPSATPGSSPGEAEAVLRQFLAAVDASDVTRAASLVAQGARFFEEEGSPIDLVSSLVCTAELVSAADRGGRLDVELRFTGPTEWHRECTEEGRIYPFAVTVADGKIVELRRR